MLAIERKNEILGRLRNEKRVLVSELAEYYNVTEETIRRDLDKLEKEGYATKTYGRCDPRQQHEDRPVLRCPQQGKR